MGRCETQPLLGQPLGTPHCSQHSQLLKPFGHKFLLWGLPADLRAEPLSHKAQKMELRTPRKSLAALLCGSTELPRHCSSARRFPSTRQGAMGPSAGCCALGLGHGTGMVPHGVSWGTWREEKGLPSVRSGGMPSWGSRAQPQGRA